MREREGMECCDDDEEEEEQEQDEEDDDDGWIVDYVRNWVGFGSLVVC